ncbi:MULTISPECIES: HNH endonuclease [Haloferax]|uniref:HNH domain-containing protein n=2 Tax=Haloferax TaxID=2251 RepID=A0A6G1Z7T0_9EURY|nr:MULTISPECIES: HNH endonuclease [Haloferax]KAB1184840.1 HNH endonuclease [Haloferax sp. CBA1149]MRW82461.1 hypothetical protein [Haloferax marinisediminis]
MDPRSSGGADAPENVIVICANCHRCVHRGNDGAEFNESELPRWNWCAIQLPEKHRFQLSG